MVCPCGGQFDPKPFQDLMMFLAGTDKSPPQSIRFLSDIGKDPNNHR
jgi:hypothetical protein